MTILTGQSHREHSVGVDVVWVFYDIRTWPGPTCPSYCDMMVVFDHRDHTVLEPMIHDYVHTNISVYTYMEGSVRGFYYANTYRDSPSDCVQMFLAGNEGDD